MNEMACADDDDPDRVEAYLLGDLDEPARESFETHLFTCDRCLAHLRLLESMRRELARQAPALRAQSVAAAPSRTWTSRWWIAAAAAAVVVAVAGGALLLRQAAPARPAPPTVSVRSAALSPAVLALAKIDPPRYVALDLRGPESASGFAEAMRAYSAGDYAAAATGLRRVRQSGSAGVEVNFFLGVSLLMSEARADAAAAIEPLTRVVSAGESPYRQLASIYLGKALVRQGILDGAAAEWERARRLQGSHTRDAEDLLTALRAARTAR